MSPSMSRRLKEKEILDYISKHRDVILEKHELSKEDALIVKELRFPHGRADVVVYGLYENLYAVPIGVEVKTTITSGTVLYRYINQLRETYENAFPIIYLATNKLKNNERKKIIIDYLSEIGYGLIEVTRDHIEIPINAKPKKTPKNEHDYCEVASKGLLYLATAKGLEKRGFKREHLKITSLWIGVDANISYCGFTRGNYALFGIYALGSEYVKRLLKFLLEEESLVLKLSEAGYRIYMESYPAMGGVKGYVRHLDESLSMGALKVIYNIVERRNKLTPIKGWGVGLGIYKSLWEVFTMPTYFTALQMINRAMDELVDFKNLVARTARSQLNQKNNT
jgi:hypothetical protein